MSFLKYSLSLLLFVFLFSCSSSTTTRRYNHKEESKEDKNTYARFSGENDEALYRGEFDEEPIEDHPVNVDKFVKEKRETLTSTKGLTSREKIMLEIVRYLNTPYKYGGNNNSGIDCSAFTQNVFSKSINYKLPRTARQQFEEGEKISNKHLLRFGDLVFFDTTKDSYPGHVGIYLGEDLFAHASFSKGVTISSLQSSYFKTRYVGARRETEIKD